MGNSYTNYDDGITHTWTRTVTKHGHTHTETHTCSYLFHTCTGTATGSDLHGHVQSQTATSTGTGRIHTATSSSSGFAPDLKKLSTTSSLMFEYQGGCSGNIRGKYLNLGAHMSLENCHKACDAAGDSCKNIEFGGEETGYQCRLWTGTCLKVNMDSNSKSMIYSKVKKAPAVATLVILI